jgi:hypothetical protein
MSAAQLTRSAALGLPVHPGCEILAAWVAMGAGCGTALADVAGKPDSDGTEFSGTLEWAHRYRGGRERGRFGEVGVHTVIRTNTRVRSVL